MNPRSVVFVFAAIGAAFFVGVARAQITATGISVPFFNDAGKLTHRMHAKTGTKQGNVQTLQGVEVHYFAADNSNVIVQKLEAEEATWDDKKEILQGRGPIVVATQDNRITGEGFDFALATSLLHIQRNFEMTNDDVVVTSDRATVELIVERLGDELKVRDVKRCEAIGNLQIVVQPAAEKKYRFRKAFSDLAVYDGATGIVSLPHPTRTIQSDGGEGRFNTLTFDRGRKSAK